MSERVRSILDPGQSRASVGRAVAGVIGLTALSLALSATGVVPVLDAREEAPTVCLTLTTATPWDV